LLEREHLRQVPVLLLAIHALDCLLELLVKLLVQLLGALFVLVQVLSALNFIFLTFQKFQGGGLLFLLDQLGLVVERLVDGSTTMLVAAAS